MRSTQHKTVHDTNSLLAGDKRNPGKTDFTRFLKICPIPESTNLIGDIKGNDC